MPTHLSFQNLPTTSRPDEVASWIKSKKKDTPRDVDPDSYGSSFMAWWIAIQPNWRVNDDASFNYVVPAAEDWRQLHKGGSVGLYTVVVALSWWIKALSAEAESSRAWSAVRDVQWVVEQIYKNVKPAFQGKKQGCDDGNQDAGNGKRYSLTFSLCFSIHTVISDVVRVELVDRLLSPSRIIEPTLT